MRGSDWCHSYLRVVLTVTSETPLYGDGSAGINYLGVNVLEILGFGSGGFGHILCGVLVVTPSTDEDSFSEADATDLATMTSFLRDAVNPDAVLKKVLTRYARLRKRNTFRNTRKKKEKKDVSRSTAKMVLPA